MKQRIVATIALAPFLVAAERRPSERVVAGEGLVNVRINGETATLRIDPAAPAMPLIDSQLAENAQLKMNGSWGVDVNYAVGSTSVIAHTKVVRIDLGDGYIKRRVGWPSHPFAAVVNGSIGPEAFPEDIIRFKLREPVAGEKAISFPMEKDTALLGMFGKFSATFGRIYIGGEPMRVRFNPHHARSLVTAGAGARLARSNNGVVSGEAVPTEIFFGVQRPVRTLALRRPLELGNLKISTLGIRTADYGSTRGIREAGDAEGQADPDEVVVIAKGKKRDIRPDTLSLGRDYLSQCSSISFNRRMKAIILTCA